MPNICAICNEPVTEKKHYWRVHKTKEKDYYEKYFPQLDRLTGEKIPFKNESSYFQNGFLNKKNLKKWLETNPKEVGLEYLKQWLAKRKEEKALVYAPTQFEIKTLQYPSIKFFHEFYGPESYEKMCIDLNLSLQFNYNLQLEFDNSPVEILCDTREQKPYTKLDFPIRVTKLDFGDYCPSPNLNNIYIERKELSDWAGVMSKSYERFERELERGQKNHGYIFILIEATQSDIQSINYLPQTKWIKASADFLLKRARDLYLKFHNFQMIAVGKRSESIRVFNQLMRLKNPQMFDIQYLIDTKKI